MHDTPPGWGNPANVQKILHLLKNDTRREIIREVYRTDQERVPGPGLSFSQLYNRVECSDRGTFNYHLNELEGIFIDRIDETYLPLWGRQKALWELLEWLEMDHEPRGPVRAEHQCPECGDALSVTYEHLRLSLSCNNHDGQTPTVWARVPPGCVSKFSLEAAAELLPHFIRTRTDRILSGICSVCYAPIDPEPVSVRDDGQSVQHVTEADNDYGRIMFAFGCDQCEVSFGVRCADIALRHPEGLSFLQRHGLDPLDDPLIYVLPTTLAPHLDTGHIVSQDPIRLETSLTVDTARCKFTLDGSGDVIAIE